MNITNICVATTQKNTHTDGCVSRKKPLTTLGVLGKLKLRFSLRIEADRTQQEVISEVKTLSVFWQSLLELPDILKKKRSHVTCNHHVTKTHQHHSHFLAPMSIRHDLEALGSCYSSGPTTSWPTTPTWEVGFRTTKFTVH